MNPSPVSDEKTATQDDSQTTSAIPEDDKKRSINAREFLNSFLEMSDDCYLMEKYELKPKQLKGIYEALIKRGLLTEYEYHAREGKAPELDEPTANSITSVGLEGAVSEETLQLYRAQWKNSGSAQPPAVTSGAGLQPTRRPCRRPGQEPMRKSESGEEPQWERCPRCNRLRHASSPDACIHCGVVFSKVEGALKAQDISIWGPGWSRQ